MRSICICIVSCAVIILVLFDGRTVFMVLCVRNVYGPYIYAGQPRSFCIFSEKLWFLCSPYIHSIYLLQRNSVALSVCLTQGEMAPHRKFPFLFSPRAVAKPDHSALSVIDIFDAASTVLSIMIQRRFQIHTVL